jgi:ethanolamine utilization protein EutA (predicted chaperonin)
MKIILTALLLLITAAVSAQSKQEAQVLALSKTIFRWDITNQVDSLANIFDEKFMMVTGTGDIHKKDPYLTFLRSGNFVHNNIDVEENIATVENSTATVVGKGKFTLTIYGSNVTMHLSYMEVFIKTRNSWKLLALHFSVLPN